MVAYDSSLPILFKMPWVPGAALRESQTGRGALPQTKGAAKAAGRSAESAGDPAYTNASLNPLPLRQAFHSYESLFNKEMQSLEEALAFELTAPAAVRSKRAIETIGNFFHWCCGIVTARMYRRLKSTNENIERQVNGNRVLLTKDYDFLNNLTVGVKRYSELSNKAMLGLAKEIQTIRNVTKQYISEFNSYIGGVWSLDSLMLQHVMQMSLQQLRLLDTIRHADMITQCRRHLIPATVVSAEMLRQSVGNLSNHVSKKGYELVIPISDADSYYKIPIAECLFSSDNVLVTVKIPLRRAEGE